MALAKIHKNSSGGAVWLGADRTVATAMRDGIIVDERGLRGNGDKHMTKQILEKLKASLTKKRAKYSKISDKHYAETNALLAELIPICDHAETKDYKWEHDNGYGRQSPHIGKMCIWCGFCSPWGDGRFSDPKTWVDHSN